MSYVQGVFGNGRQILTAPIVQQQHVHLRIVQSQTSGLEQVVERRLTSQHVTKMPGHLQIQKIHRHHQFQQFAIHILVLKMLTR